MKCYIEDFLVMIWEEIKNSPRKTDVEKILKQSVTQDI